MSGEGEPGIRIGPRQGGENQIVSAGPSPLLITRTKNRWPLKGKPGSNHTRTGEELKKVRPTAKDLVLALLLTEFFLEMKNTLEMCALSLKNLHFRQNTNDRHKAQPLAVALMPLL